MIHACGPVIALCDAPPSQNSRAALNWHAKLKRVWPMANACYFPRLSEPPGATQCCRYCAVTAEPLAAVVALYTFL